MIVLSRPRRRGAPANNSLSNACEALDDGVIGDEQLGFGYGLANSLPRDGAGEKQPADESVCINDRSLAFIGKDFGRLLLGHPSRGRTLAGAIAKALKLVCVGRAQPVVFLR